MRVAYETMTILALVREKLLNDRRTDVRYSQRYIMRDSWNSPRLVRVLVTAGIFLTLPSAAQAYIGPGAGFALLNSFFVLFATILMAALSLVLWPFRLAFRTFRRRNRPRALEQRL